jgi:signal transduction histidine kinase/ActR/RegA family two-component response regulator
MKITLVKIFLFLAIICGNTCLANAPGKLSPCAKNGLLDLRGENLFERPVALNGQWKFFWKQLVMPGDRPATSPEYVNFPSLWNNDTIRGQQLSSQGFASYTLTVLLPKQRPEIGLELPDVYSSYNFFVNGTLVARSGQPGKNRLETIPFWSSRTVNLQSSTDTLFILLQVANFEHAKGGTYKEILLGDKNQLLLKWQRDSAYDLVLAGCLFMGGLFFLGLYLFGRNDKTILYFSLFCMLYSYRMIGTDSYVLHTLLPDLPWILTIRLEYLTLTLSLMLFVRYTKCLYPEDANALVMKMVEGFCILYTLLILFTPTAVFTSLINIFLASMFICIAYAIYVYLRAARNRRAGSIYALGSSFVVILIFLLSNLNYFQFLPAMKPVVFGGYIAFFFLQSLALSQRFALSFKAAAVQAQQGLRVKSEFLSTMSHEIRTPLNAVIGMTHLLLRNQPRNDQKKDLDVLLFSATNLLSIVNNILDYNRIEEGKISFEQIPMDIAEIACHVVSGLQTSAKEKNIELKTKFDGRLDGKVLGDPTRISQVISNLVHNAVKFTENGFVLLSAVVNSCTEDQITVTISVKDTGIGIEPDKQKMIFERFTQADSSTSRNFGGTGLGLAISKRILQLQGVSLQLESEAGKGSTFYFTQTFTRYSEKEMDELAKVTETEHAALKGMSILLVEDNPFNVMVAQTMLENKGAKIDVASNGKEAIDKLNAAKHQIVLMDLNMPIMDGYEATSVLRKRGETLPIIALTASTLKEVESGIYAAGLTDIVVKPFNPEDLFRVIIHHARFASDQNSAVPLK